MRLEPELHAKQPWRVHELAHDFVLIDLWEIPIGAEPARFAELQRLIAATRPDGNRAATFLFRLREQLGHWFKWDDERNLPIPGCVETSLTVRLTDADRQRSHTGRLPDERLVSFRPIYQFDNESLQEISNRTIHALLHLSWAEGSSPRLAIYVKYRGLMSRLYMALIKPFRHTLIYPSWIRKIQRAWPATNSQASSAKNFA
jgi:hypothetical protein